MAHDYNSFAAVYDLAMGSRVDDAMFLEGLIRKHAPDARKLLELGCGSGSLIKVLQKQYSCTGIDLSSGMVKIARKKVPRCQFIVGDITSFAIAQKFDVILCAFDTINHVLNFHKWRRIFRAAHTHLNRDGIFIFDINTKAALERYASEPPFAKITGNTISIFEMLKKGPGRYQIEISALTKNKRGSFDLRKMKVPEVTYPTAKIRSALAKYFREVELQDQDRARPSVETEELYFICSRPR